MATNKAKKTQSIAPSVSTGKLTFVPGKARADHNAKRAKSVNGLTYDQALAQRGVNSPPLFLILIRPAWSMHHDRWIGILWFFGSWTTIGGSWFFVHMFCALCLCPWFLYRELWRGLCPH